LLELLIRLEYRRQTFRRKLLDGAGDLDGCFLGLAALIFFAYLPTIAAPAAAAAAAPPEAVAVGALVMIGCIFCATIIGAPLGLVIL
jgi:hypothetical protein